MVCNCADKRRIKDAQQCSIATPNLVSHFTEVKICERLPREPAASTSFAFVQFWQRNQVAVAASSLLCAAACRSHVLGIWRCVAMGAGVAIKHENGCSC
jgi:hypothetical protein